MLEPVRLQHPVLFQPHALSSTTPGAHTRYILNHKDQHMVAEALTALHAARVRGLALITAGQQEDLELEPPLDPHGLRQRAFDEYCDMEDMDLPLARDWY